MSFTSEEFNTTFDKWQEWQATPWNRLYYSTSRLNLHRHLDDCPLYVLDVGGGNGHDAIYLASIGHTVSLVDFSVAMLDDAREHATEQGVIDQMTFYQADVSALKETLSKQRFDLVLCHNMIQFVTDAYSLLRDCCSLLQPNGLLSLSATNPYSEAYHLAIWQDDLVAARESIGSSQKWHQWFDKFEHRYAAQDMIEFLQSIGCTWVGQYGIRCICDQLVDNERKSEPGYFAELEQLEHAMTDVYPYYLLARAYQIIMRKTSELQADG